MYPYRFSNVLLGYLNLITLLSAIPIIGAGLWIARSSPCASFLQAPLLALGFLVLLLSLAGFVGACFHVAWALWLYLFFLLLLIAALAIAAAFAFIVTASGGGTQVPGRPYREYKLGDYSAWLRHRAAADDKFWATALACVVGSGACSKMVRWSPLDYFQHDLTPVQSGCCKPPTACSYVAGVAAGSQDGDCYRWSNSVRVLCYGCDSCKAGVLEEVRQDWHKVSVLVIVVIVVLVLVYAVGCCAYRNARRAVSEYPYGENGMAKINPRWDYHWGRWWRDLREYW